MLNLKEYWFGRVENNCDPLGHGRVKVRIFGHHTDNYTHLPTEALPWAVVVMPVTSGGVSGIGSAPVGLQVGSSVFGTFLDGDRREAPCVLGVMVSDGVNSLVGASGPGATLPYPPTGLSDNENPFREGSCPSGDTSDNFNEQNTIEYEQSQELIDTYKGEWVFPTTGFVSDQFGSRGGGHRGVDICSAGYFKQENPGASHLNGRLRGRTGIPVVAAAEGTVIYIWKSNIGQGGRSTTYDVNKRGSRSFGNCVAIQHDTKSLGKCITIYAHLGESQDAAIDFKTPGRGVSVSVGQKVSKGQQIGTMGRTHCWDSPTHLHFEIRKGTRLPKAGNPVNPGHIFPSLMGRHQQQYNWMQNKKHDVEPPFDPAEAPARVGEEPE